MTHLEPWAWFALFALGAWHGINPAMGWLFAVALGLQKQSSRAVWQSLVPMAVGHLLAIGVVVALALLAGATLPLTYARFFVAALLLTFGLFRLISGRHPRFGGMQVGFRDLTLWSLLTASAHGAGFMLLPILLGTSTVHADRSSHAAHAPHVATVSAASAAVSIHTLAYLLVTGAIAWLVYTKLGLAILRRAWFNLDRIWALSLLLTAALTLFLST
ncbi:MAG TPA: hypothetical protein VMH31_06330 [Methylomirabilota bacterium]|nr:hypothetical protein [Methylomirabilota bacterium]